MQICVTCKLRTVGKLFSSTNERGEKGERKRKEKREGRKNEEKRREVEYKERKQTHRSWDLTDRGLFASFPGHGFNSSWSIQISLKTLFLRKLVQADYPLHPKSWLTLIRTPIRPRNWHFCISSRSHRRFWIQSMLCSPFSAPEFSSPPHLPSVWIQSSDCIAWKQALFSPVRFIFYHEADLPKLCFPPRVAFQHKNLRWLTSLYLYLMEHQRRYPMLKRVLYQGLLGNLIPPLDFATYTSHRKGLRSSA